MAAPLEMSFALLAAVDHYPKWCPDVIRYVQVLERDATGQPHQADAFAEKLSARLEVVEEAADAADVSAETESREMPRPSSAVGSPVRSDERSLNRRPP